MKQYKLNIILWSISFFIWFVIAVGRIIMQDHLLLIMINAITAVLSLINVILNVNKYKKSKPNE